MGQINTNNYPTVNSLTDADLLIVENATNGTGTTTPKQLRENAIGTGTLQTSAQTVIGAVNELKHEIDLGAGVTRYDVNTITSGYLGQFSGSANLLLLHLTTDGTADATNGYMMMLSYSRPVARFAYGRLVDSDGVAYKQDVYADNTIICTISGNGEGTESDPVQVVILGIINAGFMLTPTAVVSDRDIQDGQGNTLSVLAEALTKTASGNPVVITDCAGGKARSLITSINAIQPLHGYDHPWAGGAGKNKLNYSSTSVDISKTATSYNTVIGTFTCDSDISIIASWVQNKTLSDSTRNTIELRNRTTSAIVYASNVSDKALAQGYHESTFASVPAGSYDVIMWAQGISDDYVLTQPMIRLSSDTDTTWKPYANVCPISGRTAVAVSRYSNNLVNADELEDDKYLDGTGTAVYNVDCYVTGFIPLKSGQPIYIPATGTARRCTYYADKSFKEYLNVSAAQVLTPNFDGYLRVSVRYDTIAKNDLQINYGSAAIPFEPQGIDFTIQLGQTVYGADINWDTGVMAVDCIILTNFESANIIEGVDSTSDWLNIRYVITGSGVLNGNIGTNRPIIIAKQKNNYSGDWQFANANDTLHYYNNDGFITAFYPKSIFADLAAFKTYEASNRAQFVLPLATPTTIQLTPEQLTMLKGYNRLTIDSGSIEVGYIAKLT